MVVYGLVVLSLPANAIHSVTTDQKSCARRQDAQEINFLIQEASQTRGEKEMWTIKY